MKKDKIFKVPLLITQEEMAVLLGITRSQLTMYTSGYRDLSVKGKVKLQELIAVVKEVPFSEKAYPIPKKENIQALENLLVDNKLKQLKLQKKLVYAEERYQAALNTLHFVTNLEAKKSKINANTTVLKVLKIKVNKVLSENGLPIQEIYKIKLEVLEHERKLFDKKLKAIKT